MKKVDTLRNIPTQVSDFSVKEIANLILKTQHYLKSLARSSRKVSLNRLLSFAQEWKTEVGLHFANGIFSWTLSMLGYTANFRVLYAINQT